MNFARQVSPLALPFKPTYFAHEVHLLFQRLIVPKEGNVVTIKASDLNGYKFGNNVIIGYTYNTEVSYKVMPDKVVKEGGKYLNAWSRTDIKEVTGETGNKLYFEVDNEGKATPATSTTVDNKSVTVEGGLIN